jgi:hypothetical protein
VAIVFKLIRISKQEKEQENRFKEGILLFITEKEKKIPIPLGSTIFL